MTDDPLFILIIVACAAVLIILMLGIGSFGIGGKTAHKYSNKMMRWRIAAKPSPSHSYCCSSGYAEVTDGCPK